MQNPILDAAQTIKDGLSLLRTKITELDIEKTNLESRKHALFLQPIPVSDIKEVMFAYIDRCSDEFAQDKFWLAEVNSFLYPRRANDTFPKKNLPLNYAEAQQILNDTFSSETISMLGGYPKLFMPNFTMFQATNLAAFFFLGDSIKKKIEESYHTLGIEHEAKDVKGVGSSLAERKQEIVDIENRIMKIDIEKNELTKKLNEILLAASI